MPRLESLPANTPIDRVMEVVDRDGAVILAGMMAKADASALIDELTPYLVTTKPGRETFSGFKTTRTGALAARSARVRAALLDKRIRAVCDRVLLPNCENYQVNVAHVIRIMPGEVAQVLHRDRMSWQHLKGMEPQLNTIWALSDFTKENGATLVAPGSQSWAVGRKPKPEDLAHAEMEQGSALVYTGSVFHGGGANTTNAPRLGMNLTYCLGWLRQEENQYLSCPPEIACGFEPELQDLMGYATGGYGLGFFTWPTTGEEGREVRAIEEAVGRGRARAQTQ
jgi:hypothetical protein